MMRRSWVARAVLTRILVHTTDGRSIQGILAAVYRDELVLRHAEYLAPEGNSVLSGDTVVPRTNVAFIQTVETTK